MDDHIQHLIEQGEEAQRHFRERTSRLDTLIATWAVVANAAALVLCFNAVLDYKICAWPSVAPIAQLLLLGLVCAVAKVAFSLRVAERAERKLLLSMTATRTVASLTDAKRLALETGQPNTLSIQYDETIAKLAQLNQPDRLGTWLERLEGPLLALSFLCLGSAMYWAISGSVLAQALCPS